MSCSSIFQIIFATL